MKRRSIHDILLVVLVVVIGLCFLTGVVWILIERIKEFTTITSDPSNDIVWTLTLVGSVLVAVFKKCYEAKKEEKEEEQKHPYYYRGFNNGKIQHKRSESTKTPKRSPKLIQYRRRVKDLCSHLRWRLSVRHTDKGLCTKHFNINYQK